MEMTDPDQRGQRAFGVEVKVRAGECVRGWWWGSTSSEARMASDARVRTLTGFREQSDPVTL